VWRNISRNRTRDYDEDLTMTKGNQGESILTGVMTNYKLHRCGAFRKQKPGVKQG